VLLLVLIGFHILAALYHQFIRKDHLIGRMWYG
jgi:cytochrome b561